MPSNQVARLRNRAAEAEGRADAQAEQIERQKKELEELKRQLAARPSSSVSTPPGRGTPANRRSAARPAASPGRGSSAASQAGTIAEEEEKDEEAGERVPHRRIGLHERRLTSQISSLTPLWKRWLYLDRC